MVLKKDKKKQSGEHDFAMQTAIVDLVISYDLFTLRLERVLKPFGLNMTQMSLLNHFARMPERSWTISQLVTVMGKHQPGITKAVSALTDKGCLQKSDNEKDARVKELTITDEGLLLLQQVRIASWPQLQQGFNGLDEDEMLTFSKLLGKLKTHLDATR